MAPLSKKQIKALGMIDKIEHRFGVVWFVQAQLPGITLHTIDALVQRGYFKHEEVEGVMYYQLKAPIEVD